MSENNGKPRREDDTTRLSLDKFVQATSAGPAVPDPASEGPTMFFVKAAGEICQESPRPVVNPKDTGPLPPASVLGIVSYCYAKGVYSSDEIERKMLSNPELRAACGDAVPSAGALRRFRRLNRDAIMATLERFFRRLRRQRMTELLPGSAPVPPTHQPSGFQAGPGEDTEVIGRREAQDRVEKASFIDGMSA